MMHAGCFGAPQCDKKWNDCKPDPQERETLRLRTHYTGCISLPVWCPVNHKRHVDISYMLWMLKKKTVDTFSLQNWDSTNVLWRL
ncbi:Neurogenic Locus Notch-like Protein 3 [Manis pentadactyla]|nr:Neurogenic Locus Notch-like Protein 3 [Manis pentadactyla]